MTNADKIHPFLALTAALLLLGSLAACATPPSDPQERAEFEATNDPLEPLNRTVFEFNQFLDRILLKPAAKVYVHVMPDFAREVVHNILQNAGEPVTFMNAALQGRFHDAGKTASRFLVNTVAGLGGVADLGTGNGLDRVNADFGQTLHVWGMPEGPFLMLPVFGPSNPRDAVGFAVDSIAEPWSHVVYAASGNGDSNRYTISKIAASALDQRSRNLDTLDALEKSSIDFYAQLRSVSRQHRRHMLGIVDEPPADIGRMSRE